MFIGEPDFNIVYFNPPTITEAITDPRCNFRYYKNHREDMITFTKSEGSGTCPAWNDNTLSFCNNATVIDTTQQREYTVTIETITSPGVRSVSPNLTISVKVDYLDCGFEPLFWVSVPNEANRNFEYKYDRSWDLKADE